jgi:hypothetical protein
MSNNTAKPPNNGTILIIAQIVKAVMSLAAEAKVGALYINCREAIPARHTLEFMGHPQPPTPMQTDNTTALGVINNNVKMGQTVLLCKISNDCMAPYLGPRGAYVMS